jgi:hypothetical protein
MAKKKMIEKDLLTPEEVIVDQPKDLNEMIAAALMAKKVGNPLSSKRSLEVSKKNLSKSLQRNLLFNLNNFCH